MTIRQCAGLDPMHQDIKLCGWERATAREVLEAKHPLIGIDMAKGADRTAVFEYRDARFRAAVVDLSKFFGIEPT